MPYSRLPSFVGCQRLWLVDYVNSDVRLMIISRVTEVGAQAKVLAQEIAHNEGTGAPSVSEHDVAQIHLVGFDSSDPPFDCYLADQLPPALKESAASRSSSNSMRDSCSCVVCGNMTS